MNYDPLYTSNLPGTKVPGIISLNVLASNLTMHSFSDCRKQFESWPEVPALRLECARLFPGQPFVRDTIELLMAWFQERGLSAEQARHLPLSEAIRLFSLEKSALENTSNAEHVDNLNPKSRKEMARQQRLANAMLLVNSHPDWSNATIAKKIGTSPSTLSRDKTYQAAAELARGNKADVKRGHINVDPDTGLRDVEAYTGDDPAKMNWDD